MYSQSFREEGTVAWEWRRERGFGPVSGKDTQCEINYEIERGRNCTDSPFFISFGVKEQDCLFKSSIMVKEPMARASFIFSRKQNYYHNPITYIRAFNISEWTYTRMPSFVIAENK